MPSSDEVTKHIAEHAPKLEKILAGKGKVIKAFDYMPGYYVVPKRDPPFFVTLYMNGPGVLSGKNSKSYEKDVDSIMAHYKPLDDPEIAEVKIALESVGAEVKCWRVAFENNPKQRFPLIVFKDGNEWRSCALHGNYLYFAGKTLSHPSIENPHLIWMGICMKCRRVEKPFTKEKLQGYTMLVGRLGG